MSWITRMDHFLTNRRMSYAWITGIVLWAAWLISIAFGQGILDLAGNVIGTDYIQFYAAGETVRQGQSADLYNFVFQSQLEQAIAGPELTSFHAFITPPFFAWLYVPFTYLPYTWSFFAWSALSLIFLWGSIKLISTNPKTNSFLWALTWFPVFAAISFGQNSLLSLFLICLTYYLWKKDKYLAAGLVSSLLLYKPQMVLGLGILWLIDYRRSWRSLIGLACGGAILAGLSFWLLPDASQAYLNLSRNFLPGLIYQDQFPIWHLYSLRGFWFLLLAGNRTLAEVLSLILSLGGILVYIFLWRNHRDQKDLLFAAAICLTIWISPHAMVYDWCILIIPAIIFWEHYPYLKPLLKALYALVWVAALISAPLTIAQLEILPVALQISLPVLFLAYLQIFRQIRYTANENLNNELVEQ
jgi:alpha-1,2-mannosyltransferase